MSNAQFILKCCYCYMITVFSQSEICKPLAESDSMFPDYNKLWTKDCDICCDYVYVSIANSKSNQTFQMVFFMKVARSSIVDVQLCS